jgi:hypothetical protein
MERFDGLDILGLGLRISNSNRNLEGSLRFNDANKKFEGYTGIPDVDGNDWVDISTPQASETEMGSIKVGNNLFMNTSNGKLHAISVGTSMFYQHIVTVSKYTVPTNSLLPTSAQYESTLPGGTVIQGGSGDFSTISAAISFIQSLSSTDYPRNKDNQWLIYVAPGTYKEDFSLIPFISLKGYSKNATILEPTDTTTQHIKMTTDSSLMDLTISFNNNIDNLNFTLIEVDSNYAKNSVPTASQVFNNNILLKDIDIELSNINSANVINVTNGNLKFENSFLNLEQDQYNAGQTSSIYLFYLLGSTKLDLISSQINVKSNHQNVFSIYSDSAKVNVINSFLGNMNNINNSISNSIIDASTNYLFKILSSDVIVRNSQLINNSLNGIGFDLLNTTNLSSIKILSTEVTSLIISNNILTLVVTNTTVAGTVKLKLEGKKGLKILTNNYKVSHITYDNVTFKIKLDTDRSYTDANLGAVEILVLNSVSIANTYIRANNKIIESTSDNYLIETNNVCKEEADYNITGESLVELNNFNVIHVRKDKGDFNSISQALSSLGKLDSNLRYLIKVHTGVYTETSVIDLSNHDNVDIIGDSQDNTEIKLVFTSIPTGDVLVKGGSGLIKNIKFSFTNALLMSSKLALIKFTSKDVKMINVNFETVSNNINVIELVSCGTTNILENVKINHQYYFREDAGGAVDTIYGINATLSNSLKIKNVEVIIIAHSSFEAGINNAGKTINNVHLNDTRIEALNLHLELTTELVSCNLIFSEESISNNFKNYIYGDSLLLNSSEVTNFILKHATTGRFIIINSNILGDFSGTNVFTTGCVLLHPDDTTSVHSYHTSLLSNNKDSILIGNSAGNATMGQTGKRNILVGKESGKLITTGDDNILVGNSSGIALVGHDRNILFGNSAGTSLTGDEAIMIGYKSGYSSANKNLFMGSYSGYNITGSNNLALGNNTSSITGYSNITNSNNIFIGNDAGIQSSGDNNINLGEGSGRRDTGGYSVSIGNYTSSTLVSGGSSESYYATTMPPKSDPEPSPGYNVSLGYLAGKNLTTGARSIHIGAGAGENTDKDDNIFIGYKAGKDATGDENIFVGKSAGEDINGTKNVVVGKDCMIGVSGSTDTAANNLILGNETGKYIVSNNNVVLGIDTASANKKFSNDNVVIGFQSGKNMGTATGNGPASNVFVGKDSGYNAQGDNNTYVGKDAGKESTTGHSNTYLGYGAAKTVTTSNASVIIGFNAGSNSSSLDSDTFVGYSSGINATGTNNTLIGFNAGTTATNYNTFVGNEAGKSATGASNVIIGSESGANIASDYNIVIGSSSVTQTLTAANNGNIVIGYDSGNKIVASGNTYIGYQAGKDNAGTNNTVIGDSAMKGDKTTQNNVIIGKNAGTNLQGDFNLVIGSSAGESNITNKIDNNFLLGYQAGKTNNKYNKLFVVGNNSGIAINESTTQISYYDDSENIIIGNSSGAVVSSRGNLLLGNNTGNLVTGDSNMMIGEKTGTRLTTGSNNLFMGSGKSFIFKKIADTTTPDVKYNDLSNTYRDGNDGSPGWSLTNVTSPNVLLKGDGNAQTDGYIEFILSEPTTNDKVFGIKSFTTFNDFRFNNISIIDATFGSNNLNLIKIHTDTNNENQLKNKMFIRNFGGNNWGEYKNGAHIDLVPDIIYTKSGTDVYTSKLEYLDLGSTHSYKKNRDPIIFHPDDILEVKFKKAGVAGILTIIVKVYAIIQVVKKPDNSSITTVSEIDLIKTQAQSNPYHIMDERLYFDLLVDDQTNNLGATDFIIDNTVEMSITHVSSAGHYNMIGNYNNFIGIDSGNSSVGEDNLFIGHKSGKNSYAGSRNTIIGNNSGELLREGSSNTIMGKEAGKYVNSVSNVIIGNETAKNSLNISDSILIGDSAASNITGSSNIIIGHHSGKDLTTNNNNLLLGNKALHNSTTGNNNIVLGNNIDECDSGNADVSDTLMVGNKSMTRIRRLGNETTFYHLYIPVDDASIFDYNELLKVYNSADPSTFNYLNTVMDTSLYMAQPKSIVHTFPQGKCELIISGTSILLKDYSNQLKNIQFLNYTNIVKSNITDISTSTFNYKRPLISIERLGAKTNGKYILTNDQDGIYEIYGLPTLIADGSYTYITMKKLKKSTAGLNYPNNFITSENVNEDLTALAKVSIRINNNILVLSNNASTGSSFGRGDSQGINIYSSNTSATWRPVLSLDEGTGGRGFIIEKVPNIIYTGGDLNGTGSGPDKTFDHIGVEKVFKIGDLLTRSVNNNATEVFKSGIRVVDITLNKITLESYTPGGTTASNLRTGGNQLRFIKETETTTKPILGNFNSNKIIINGESSDITEKASLIVKGSIGLRDFLSLKITDGFPNKMTPIDEGIVWLQLTDVNTFTTSNVNTTDDILSLGSSNHNLIEGESLIFESGSIGGLNVGTTYFVIDSSGTDIKLATSLGNATASPQVPISLTTAGTGGVFAFNAFYLVHTGSNIITSLNGKINIAKTNHNLSTGDEVLYNKVVTNPVGATISELVDHTSYFVIKIDNNNFSLADIITGAVGGNKKDLASTPSSITIILTIIKNPQLKMKFKESLGVAVTKNILLY